MLLVSSKFDLLSRSVRSASLGLLPVRGEESLTHGGRLPAENPRYPDLIPVEGLRIRGVPGKRFAYSDNEVEAVNFQNIKSRALR